MVQQKLVSSEKTNEKEKNYQEELIQPELRFPEFKDNWTNHKLGEISKIQRGASPRPISDKKWYDTENKTVGWVRIGDVTNSFKFLDETEDYFSEEGIKKSRFIPKGSLIMSICATIGKPIITNMDVCIHDGFIGFSELKGINEEFLYYNLNILENKFCSLGQTGSQANLNSDLVRDTKINIPSIKEQEKIVDFLSKIDKKIELLEKKLVLYQELELTLKNNIFFKNLKNSAYMKLKEICSIKKGKQLNKSDMIENGDYYVLNGGKEPSGFTNLWNVKENTITISEGGNSCGFVSFNYEKFYCGGHCYYLTLKQDDIDLNYLFHYLKYIEPIIMRLRVGSGLPNIQKRDIENINILHLKYNKQKEIGKLFKSINEKISLILKEKEELVIFKKGLLQKMFV